MNDYQEHVDPETRLAFLAGPGVYVVPVEQPISRQRIVQAIALLERLRRHPLDVGALALADGYTLPAEVVADFASRGIVIPRVHAESARARAVKYIQQFLSLRRDGLVNLNRFAQATRAAMRPRLSQKRTR